jgi:hypothetical protein
MMMSLDIWIATNTTVFMGKDDIHVDVTPVEYAFLLRKPYYEA